MLIRWIISKLKRKKRRMVDFGFGPVEEADTECDLCTYEDKDQCYLISVRTIDCIRDHFIPDVGYSCPLKKWK